MYSLFTLYGVFGKTFRLLSQDEFNYLVDQITLLITVARKVNDLWFSLESTFDFQINIFATLLYKKVSDNSIELL